MKIYYIDDSFFAHSEFARQMAYKLEVLLRENELSTQTVEIDGNSFLLTNNTLRMPNEEIRGFAGTLCVIDTTTLKWKRIYLDLFPDEETDIITLLTEAIEESLGLDDSNREKS